MFPETIETDRLRLERLGPDTVDTLALYEHVNPSAPHIDEITRYLSWDPHASPKETHEFLTDARQAWDERESAQFVVRPREGEDGAGEIAGCAGLIPDWDRQIATLGVWLRKRFWGRGYSGERAGALLELAFEDLDLEIVAVTHHVDNENSRRAIERYVERFGGRKEGTIRNGNRYEKPVDVVRYSVSQAEYRDAVSE
ncbi:GNAT family N-acetyltransferase [Halapricum desulfuricans]|uniref:Acetyltransferase, RimL family n=1 Tax=Halapricum desulfuricans TaxID=2841257 RepID=A0A897N0E8_9EURY|nr:GNAT family protein [Halapricum desulfuricans]QSG06164.1 Acetyltransferase, RimL family [Halapricum desulfuricans]